ncbi:glutamate receptor 2.3-like protein [Cinnamomum micranthum f. kanehirae]|uniref:Glutamate receptor 2.3-like protein n=1 Tax=Cinnamomum micranthum f. kanehirae TaxID=337451 RepID=A0A443NA10_9MAGN|nr:glutamate receptor 2.3-like protein [Cinnamomum micranthum f. kanehirae]
MLDLYVIYKFSNDVYVGERLVSNWSKFVVIIWLFVVWILTTSYTANFTSLLTIQQLQPAVNDISDLIKNRDNVGYQDGGFVVNLLRTMNVEESHLKAYTYAEEFAEALSNGSVTAIFDEIPYLRLFLAKNENCGKYKMVGPIYKTGGFGFVFPMGSPLVPDMSRAILNVTQGPIMKLIEKKWIQAEFICSDQPTTTTSNSLTLDSFWGLFLITCAASILAFFIFLSKFLYKNRHLLCDSSVSFVQRLKGIIRRFDERDLTCHTSRPKEDLAIGTGHAENTQPQDFHPLPLEREPIARRRWNMLYRAWLFRSTYARVHHAEMI